MDLAFVRETYQKMSDAELERVVTQDAAGLTPEAQEIVKEEIQRRNLSPTIIKGVQAQNRQYTIAEIDVYCEMIRGVGCPTCASDAKLNGTQVNEVFSIVILTHYKKELKIACPHCLDKASSDAIVKTAVLGWWGIPWGIVRTIQAISRNISNKRVHHSEEPNKYLRSFVLGRIGQLETYRNDKERLREIIAAK